MEIFKQSEWICPSEIILEDEGQLEENIDDVRKKEIEMKKNAMERKKKDEVKPTGKVVGIIRRKWRQYCGNVKCYFSL